MIKKLISVMSFLLSFLACPLVLGAGYLNNFTITELQYSSNSNSGVHIVFAGGTWSSGKTNPDNCGVATRLVVAYSIDDPNVQRITISGLTMAFALGKTLRAWVDGCIIGVNNDTYPRVRLLHVQ